MLDAGQVQAAVRLALPIYHFNLSYISFLRLILSAIAFSLSLHLKNRLNAQRAYSTMNRIAEIIRVALKTLSFCFANRAA